MSDKRIDERNSRGELSMATAATGWRLSSAAGDTIQGLSQEIGVAVVPRVLTDQVYVDHPQ